MNVLQLISSGGYYGAENVVVSLSESLEKHNCRSVIGVFHNDYQRNEELIRQAERRGLRVEKINCLGRWDRQTIGVIREKLKNLNIDLLHTHGYKPDIYGYLAARTVELPVISTCHLWTHDTVAVRFYEFLDSLFLRHFDAVVAVSEKIEKSLHRAGVRRSATCVIDNGVDLNSFSRACPTLAEKIRKGEKFVVGTVGRLVPQKGLEYLLCAAQGVISEYPDIIFAIIGAGPDHDKLEHLATELGIQQNVVFTGLCSDMPGAYASIDVFVLASIDEGMPMALIEALASKRPVIATSVGAIPRLVIHQKTGLLVKPKDVQALRVAILKLINDRSLRSELGIAGEALVNRNHSQEGMAKAYLELYKQINDLSHARSLNIKSSEKSCSRYSSE